MNSLTFGRGPERPEGFDVMQICANGHQITDRAQSKPDLRQKHCDQCGGETIDACPECTQPIRGTRHRPGVGYIRVREVPKYCYNCGVAYPWQQAAMDNLREILRDEGISEADMATFETALPDVVSETPKSESAALKVGKVLSRLGKPAYDISVKVISDLASETAKKTMGW